MRRRGARRESKPAAPAGTARVAALRLLGRRDYTVQELRTRLLAKGFPADDIGATLDRLVTEGLADDRRAAVAHLRAGSAVKGRGRLRLRLELKARGVADDLTAELLADRTDDDELVAVRAVLSRKGLAPAGLPMADRRRMFQQLLRRGFSADVIALALKG